MNYRNDRYNGSGCLDMTAYLALRNISRTEHKQLIQTRRNEKANTDNKQERTKAKEAS